MDEGGFQLEGHDVGEYTLAKAKSSEALVKSVNSLIKEKWFPIGSPVAVNTTEGAGLLQALVRSKSVRGKKISTPSV